MDAAQSSLGGSSTQEQQQQQQRPLEQERETRPGLEPALTSQDSGPAERQLGQRLDGPPVGLPGYPETGVQRNCREEGGQQEPVPQGQHAVEAERQLLVRQLQRSSEAAQHAEKRVREVEAAWQVLTEEVVALAKRNADLEWVSECMR